MPLPVCQNAGRLLFCAKSGTTSFQQGLCASLPDKYKGIKACYAVRSAGAAQQTFIHGCRAAPVHLHAARSIMLTSSPLALGVLFSLRSVTSSTRA